MTAAVLLPLVAVYIWSLGDSVRPVGANHFMGGVIYWKPVQITHRTVWNRYTCIPDQPTSTQSTTAAFMMGQLECQRGCNGIIGNSTFNCTDFGFSDITWSAGETIYIYNFGTTVPYFEASYNTSSWVSSPMANGTLWKLLVRGNLTYREDIGLINSSPVVNLPSVIYRQHECQNTIKISAYDADGDDVRCRRAMNDECAKANCIPFPGNLNERDCELELYYDEATNETGQYYPVALQVEDFATPTDITPLSSIPLQFTVQIMPSNQSCSDQPELVGQTPTDGSCIGVPLLSTWSTVIIARIPFDSSATSITDIITASPLGLKKSGQAPNGNPREWQETVTWVPAPSQFGPNSYCFAALDNTNKLSTQNCITLLGGAEPRIIATSFSPIGNIFHNHNSYCWSVQFDKQFFRPSKDRFIRIFNEKEEVISINVATSSAVEYPNDTLGRTLTFHVNYNFPENQIFYILLDGGVAVGNDYFNCNIESLALRDRTLWTFKVVPNQNLGRVVIIVSTVLAFVFGISCGLICYHYIGKIIRWIKVEQQSIPSPQNEEIGLIPIAHDNNNTSNETSAVYAYADVKPGMTNGQMELEKNIAYGKI